VLAEALFPVILLLPLPELPFMKPGMAPPNICCIAGDIIPPPNPMGPKEDIIGGIIPGPIIGKGLIPLIIGFPLIMDAAIIGFIMDPMPPIPLIPPIGGIPPAGAAIVTYPANFIPGGGADPGAPTMAPAGTPVEV